MASARYALVPKGGEPHADQLVASVASLRRHEPLLAVRVDVFGRLPPPHRDALELLGAEVADDGDAVRPLDALTPGLERWLVHTPGIAKWLDPRGVVAGAPVLLLDCDTYVDRPLAELLDDTGPWDVVAREEPHTATSPLGHDPGYLDEARLAALAGRPATPFNGGVAVLGASVADALAAQSATLVELTLRLQLGARANGTADDWSDASLDAVPPATLDGLEPIEPPTRNPWIAPQVALWLLLAGMPEATVRLADPDVVVQGAEFLDRPDRGFAICHYFTGWTTAFFAWRREAAGRAAPPALGQRVSRRA